MTPSDLRNLAPAAVDIPAHDKLGADGATLDEITDRLWPRLTACCDEVAVLRTLG